MFKIIKKEDKKNEGKIQNGIRNKLSKDFIHSTLSRTPK